MNRYLILLLAVFATGCGSRQPVESTAQDADAHESTTREAREQLLAVPPRDWQLAYQMNEVETRISEFLPPDQSPADWKTKLVFESHANLATTDPLAIIMAEVRRQQETCSFVQHFNVFSGFENNYPTSTRLVMCGKNEVTETGQVHLFKAIQGDRYLYVVRVELRVEPFEVNQPEVDQREIAAWSNYLKHIHLCNPEDAEHPCPRTSEPQE